MLLGKEKAPSVWRTEGAPENLLFGDVDTKLCINDNTMTSNCQEGFDKECDEISKKFTPKRLDAEKLAASYARLDMVKRSARVADCGTFLEFRHEMSLADGSMSAEGKLNNANFCKDRLCPLCSWRRSYKIFAQVSQIMELIGDKYQFLFLTLTVPNVDGSELSESITKLMKAFHSLEHRKRFKNAVKGFFRALEITRNERTGQYHPHFHCVLAVSKSYLKKSDYITHAEWLDMWRKSTGDDTITQVDIRVARDKHSLKDEKKASAQLASAVAEIAKYAVKSGDYLLDDDELTDEIVGTLAPALFNRRLAAFGGCFKDAAAQLKLDDAEDGDLVHINDDSINGALAYVIVRYGWSCGAYKLIDTNVKQADEL